MAEIEVLNLAHRYADAVRQAMTPRAVFLYGSHANGNSSENSDIDIAVVVDELTEDYLSVAKLLWELTRNISDEIEPVLLTPKDAESGFLQTVEKTGIAI